MHRGRPASRVRKDIDCIGIKGLTSEKKKVNTQNLMEESTQVKYKAIRASSYRVLPQHFKRLQKKQSRGKNKIRLMEVGLRDGLQNEESRVPLEKRLKLVRQLIDSGLKHIELGAFVRPEKVPQMACSPQLIQRVLSWQKAKKIPSNIHFSALVPNRYGMEQALQTGLKEVAFFTSTSKTFNQKNTNSNLAQSLNHLKEIIHLGQRHKIRIRVYLSTCFDCPYEGKIAESKVLKYSSRLLEMGVEEIAISDTIGSAHPKRVNSLLDKLLKEIPCSFLAMHFHNNYGQALINILCSIDFGIQKFDASIGGLGGCPYAPHAAGNVATEDVFFLLKNLNYSLGLRWEPLLLAQQMAKNLVSKSSKPSQRCRS